MFKFGVHARELQWLGNMPRGRNSDSFISIVDFINSLPTFDKDYMHFFFRSSWLAWVDFLHWETKALCSLCPQDQR